MFSSAVSYRTAKGSMRESRQPVTTRVEENIFVIRNQATTSGDREDLAYVVVRSRVREL
jgi:hypothetical protein